ncbi:MAG: TetR family transcriptional regulator [Pseudonocardiaceae bacterium]|nr:TetR family transcriptional regulator [Pseudonocardiaceae bacterium]
MRLSGPAVTRGAVGRVKVAGTGRAADRSGAELQEHILRCVVKLVGVRGFEKVRLRDVAAEAGVSVGSLQHYFDTRSTLMQRAFAYQGERVIAELESAAQTGASPWQRIEALVSYATVTDGFRDRCTVWLEFSAASARDPGLRSVMERVYEGWRAPLRDAIEQGVQQGVFSPAMPTEQVVDMILTLIDGFELATAGRIRGFNGKRAHDVVLATTASVVGLPATTSTGA